MGSDPPASRDTRHWKPHPVTSSASLRVEDKFSDCLEMASRTDAPRKPSKRGQSACTLCSETPCAFPLGSGKKPNFPPWPKAPSPCSGRARALCHLSLGHLCWVALSQVLCPGLPLHTGPIDALTAQRPLLASVFFGERTQQGRLRASFPESCPTHRPRKGKATGRGRDELSPPLWDGQIDLTHSHQKA